MRSVPVRANFSELQTVSAVTTAMMLAAKAVMNIQ